MNRPTTREELSELGMKQADGDYTEINESFYHRLDWQNLRNGYILNHNYCEICLNSNEKIKSKDVHHVIPLTQNGDPFSQSNLIALCKTCHKAAHAGLGMRISLSSMFKEISIMAFVRNKNLEPIYELDDTPLGDKIDIKNEFYGGMPYKQYVAYNSLDFPIGIVTNARFISEYTYRLSANVQNENTKRSIELLYAGNVFTYTNELYIKLKVSPSQNILDFLKIANESVK